MNSVDSIYTKGSGGEILLGNIPEPDGAGEYNPDDED